MLGTQHGRPCAPLTQVSIVLNHSNSFHCLFCHGYEQRGRASAGVLAIDDVAPLLFALHHVARNAAQLVVSVTIYTNKEASQAAAIRDYISPKAPITVNTRRITKFTLGPGQNGITLHFKDRTTKNKAFLNHKPKSKVKSSGIAE